MFHFHDVDILLKLAACELLDDLTELLAVKAADIRILETAIFKIRRLGKKGTYPERVISRAIRFCEAHEEITTLENTVAAEALSALGDGMDAGEVILFASALENPTSRVVTGDKRALRMLGKLGKDHKVVRSLHGRVVCFEELLLRTFEARGFDRLCKHCHAVWSMMAFFGSHFVPGWPLNKMRRLKESVPHGEHSTVNPQAYWLPDLSQANGTKIEPLDFHQKHSPPCPTNASTTA
jgi:hypothetical protein